MINLYLQKMEKESPSSFATFVPKVHIEAVQTVAPIKITDPREARLVTIKDVPTSGILQRCFYTLLYYNKATEDDSGRVLAGWFKESLGRALSEQPLLAGRLKDSDGQFVLVSNDCGIRLVEAHISITMAEFLDSKEREGGEEAKLVFWKDIDEENPQFSPLYYVQVTNFECGGYSVGISSSLLLADPPCMTSFLKRWANIHNTMLLDTNLPKEPLFLLPECKRTGPSWNYFSSNSSKNQGQTMFFKIAEENIDSEDVTRNMLTTTCIEQAEAEVGREMASKFSLFVKGSNGEVIVETCSKQNFATLPLSHRIGLTCANWDDLGINEVIFREGNKPCRVSCWIDSSCDHGGVVMVIPSHDEGMSEMNITVTIPNDSSN